MAVKVILPQMGEGVIEATVTKWLKNVGDEVKEYDPLVEVNTDKVDTEIPSPVSGTVLKVLIGEGNTAPVNSILAWIGKPGEQVPENGGGSAPKAASKLGADKAAPSPQPAPAVAPQPVPAATRPQAAVKPIAPTTQPGPQKPGAAVSVSPLVARIAAENKVDLAAVPGTGPGGRITKEDVLAFVRSGGNGAPAVGGQVTLPKFDGQNLATFLSPVVKKLAQENNLDPTRIQGSGQGGRVTKKDIETFLASGHA
ncbi:MAG TPA: E3 binding domain-containing protein, partial [Anaerolineales bacterium]